MRTIYSKKINKWNKQPFKFIEAISTNKIHFHVDPEKIAEKRTVRPIIKPGLILARNKLTSHASLASIIRSLRW